MMRLNQVTPKSWQCTNILLARTSANPMLLALPQPSVRNRSEGWLADPSSGDLKDPVVGGGPFTLPPAHKLPPQGLRVLSHE